MTTMLDHANPVHQFLLSPSSYPEPTSEVELRETHISWVYLTDRYVYKQKKPVRFEFLDFSTPEKRRHYCEQELMLNQRLSPEVYLGVVPISCDSAGSYHLKHGKDTVEWLVKMKRLDEASTLEHLILNKGLTDTHIQRLSRRLTTFYSGQAPAMVRSSEFLQRLNQHAFANRNDLLISLTDAENAIQFATNAQLRCLSMESEYFVQRVADGRVVDGHGDLRPEHIYFHRNKPLIIDCIEFNSEYRTNDVVDELAFLTMECDRLGSKDVGESLFAAYLRAGTDDPKPFLSTFYKCYRACVRAKVCALRAAQAAGEGKTQSLEKSRIYLGLAKRYAEELGPKIVIVVGGLSGTGKSTLANALQEPLAAELLQTDVLRKGLYDEDAPGNGKYTRDGRNRVYDEMVEHMEEAMSRSPTLVLDGTFSSTANRQAVRKQAHALGATVLQVQCECSADEARARIAERIAHGNGVSEATPELHAQQATEYEAVISDLPLVRIDTSQAGPLQLEIVMAAVRELIGSTEL